MKFKEKFTIAESDTKAQKDVYKLYDAVEKAIGIAMHIKSKYKGEDVSVTADTLIKKLNGVIISHVEEMEQEASYI